MNDKKILRLVSWNCGGGFSSAAKQEFIGKIRPNLLICQEPRDKELPGFKKIIWKTNQPEKKSPKGLGVYISNDDIKIEVQDALEDFEIFLPFKLNYFNLSIYVIAVWAYNGRSKGKYRKKKGMILDAIDEYKRKYAENSIWIGDFNNGPTIRAGKFWYPAVDKLKNAGLEQICFPNIEYTHRNNKGSLHSIDHCFVSNQLKKTVQSNKVIPLEESASDHSPLILELAS